MTTETRATWQATGGQKGVKQCRPGLIPAAFLEELGKVYGYGAEKYKEDNNWAKGYPWSWSLDALERHLLAWKRGEADDPDSHLHHLAHAAWHCATLVSYERYKKGVDDRVEQMLQQKELVAKAGPPFTVNPYLCIRCGHHRVDHRPAAGAEPTTHCRTCQCQQFALATCRHKQHGATVKCYRCGDKWLHHSGHTCADGQYAHFSSCEPL